MLKIKHLKHDQREKAFLPLKGITDQIATDLYLAIKHAENKMIYAGTEEKQLLILNFIPR